MNFSYLFNSLIYIDLQIYFSYCRTSLMQFTIPSREFFYGFPTSAETTLLRANAVRTNRYSGAVLIYTFVFYILFW